MNGETISLRKEEQRRLMVLNLVQVGQITVVEATERLRMSLRHVRRLLARYRKEGAAALAHGNRGRTPTIAFTAAFKAQVLELAAQPCYAGCNDTHLAELLDERDGMAVSRATLRRWLRGAGRPSPKKRRSRRFRKYRERSPRRGLLVQIDTSFHRWLEDRGPELALVGAIDDATGEVLFALFRDQEDTDGYFLMLAHILKTCGIPGAFYHDGRSTFVLIRHQEPSLDDQLAGLVPQTQFARAADDLGISMIHASSPQAKGRIERLWNTLQDRLIIELRLAGIATKEAANAFLPGFLKRYNRRFARSPAEPESAFLPLPPNLDVPAVCSHHFYRTVSQDNTVSVDGIRLQLPPGPRATSRNRTRVQVQRRPDGTWAVYHNDKCIVHPAPIVAEPAPKAQPLPAAALPTKAPRPASPQPLTHPWKRALRAAVLQKQALVSQAQPVTKSLNS